MAYRFVEPFEDVGSGIVPSSGAKLFFFDVGTSNPKTTFSDFALSVANPDPVVANPNGIFPDIFLDINADRTLKDKNDVLIYGPDTVFSPGSSLASVLASIVTVLDAGGNFTAADVEAVLAEIATDYMRQNRAETITGTKTFSGANIDLANNQLIQAQIHDYTIDFTLVSSSAGTLTLDVENGNSFETTLTENTTVVIQNLGITGAMGEMVTKFTQDGAGGAFTVAWPASVLWPGGTAPIISIGNDAVDIVTLQTWDSGTTIYGNFSQAFS